MKHLLLLLVLIGALTNQEILAQSDPNNDPNWDWRASTVFTIYPQANGGNPINTTSPFYQGGISVAVQDNEPVDGWRLVIRDFGWTVRAVPVPHFILYNKHQGLLRIFVFTMMPNTFTDGGLNSFGRRTIARLPSHS